MDLDNSETRKLEYDDNIAMWYLYDKDGRHVCLTSDDMEWLVRKLKDNGIPRQPLDFSQAR